MILNLRTLAGLPEERRKRQLADWLGPHSQQTIQALIEHVRTDVTSLAVLDLVLPFYPESFNLLARNLIARCLFIEHLETYPALCRSELLMTTISQHDAHLIAPVLDNAIAQESKQVLVALQHSCIQELTVSTSSLGDVSLGYWVDLLRVCGRGPIATFFMAHFDTICEQQNLTPEVVLESQVFTYLAGAGPDDDAISTYQEHAIAPEVCPEDDESRLRVMLPVTYLLQCDANPDWVFSALLSIFSNHILNYAFVLQQDSSLIANRVLSNPSRAGLALVDMLVTVHGYTGVEFFQPLTVRCYNDECLATTLIELGSMICHFHDPYLSAFNHFHDLAHDMIASHIGTKMSFIQLALPSSQPFAFSITDELVQSALDVLAVFPNLKDIPLLAVSMGLLPGTQHCLARRFQNEQFVATEINDPHILEEFLDEETSVKEKPLLVTQVDAIISTLEWFRDHNALVDDESRVIFKTSFQCFFRFINKKFRHVAAVMIAHCESGTKLLDTMFSLLETPLADLFVVRTILNYYNTFANPPTLKWPSLIHVAPLESLSCLYSFLLHFSLGYLSDFNLITMDDYEFRQLLTSDASSDLQHRVGPHVAFADQLSEEQKLWRQEHITWDHCDLRESFSTTIRRPQFLVDLAPLLAQEGYGSIFYRLVMMLCECDPRNVVDLSSVPYLRELIIESMRNTLIPQLVLAPTESDALGLTEEDMGVLKTYGLSAKFLDQLCETKNLVTRAKSFVLEFTPSDELDVHLLRVAMQLGAARNLNLSFDVYRIVLLNLCLRQKEAFSTAIDLLLNLVGQKSPSTKLYALSNGTRFLNPNSPIPLARVWSASFWFQPASGEISRCLLFGLAVTAAQPVFTVVLSGDRLAVNTRNEDFFFDCAPIMEGMWYHLALVHDGRDVRIYLNGTPHTVRTRQRSGGLSSSKPKYLIFTGSDEPNANSSSIVSLAHPYLFNGALSSAEVSILQSLPNYYGSFLNIETLVHPTIAMESQLHDRLSWRLPFSPVNCEQKEVLNTAEGLLLSLLLFDEALHGLKRPNAPENWKWDTSHLLCRFLSLISRQLSSYRLCAVFPLPYLALLITEALQVGVVFTMDALLIVATILGYEFKEDSSPNLRFSGPSLELFFAWMLPSFSDSQLQTFLDLLTKFFGSTTNMRILIEAHLIDILLDLQSDSMPLVQSFLLQLMQHLPSNPDLMQIVSSRLSDLLLGLTPVQSRADAQSLVVLRMLQHIEPTEIDAYVVVSAIRDIHSATEAMKVLVNLSSPQIAALDMNLAFVLDSITRTLHRTNQDDVIAFLEALLSLLQRHDRNGVMAHTWEVNFHALVFGRPEHCEKAITIFNHRGGLLGRTRIIQALAFPLVYFCQQQEPSTSTEAMDISDGHSIDDEFEVVDETVVELDPSKPEAPSTTIQLTEEHLQALVNIILTLTEFDQTLFNKILSYPMNEPGIVVVTRMIQQKMRSNNQELLVGIGVRCNELEIPLVFDCSEQMHQIIRQQTPLITRRFDEFRQYVAKKRIIWQHKRINTRKELSRTIGALSSRRTIETIRQDRRRARATFWFDRSRLEWQKKSWQLWDTRLADTFNVIDISEPVSILSPELPLHRLEEEPTFFRTASIYSEKGFPGLLEPYSNFIERFPYIPAKAITNGVPTSELSAACFFRWLRRSFATGFPTERSVPPHVAPPDALQPHNDSLLRICAEADSLAIAALLGPVLFAIQEDLPIPLVDVLSCAVCDRGLDITHGLLLVLRERLVFVPKYAVVRTSEGDALDCFAVVSHQGPSVGRQWSLSEAIAYVVGTYFTTGDSIPDIWSTSVESIQNVHRSSYLLHYPALEVIASYGSRAMLVFDAKAQREAVFDSLTRRLNISPTTRQESTSRLTQRWLSHDLTNFDYLFKISEQADRSFLNLAQYPLMPWVLADFQSDQIDLANRRIYRDFGLPMGAQNPERRAVFESRYEDSKHTGLPPFHYGTCLSASGSTVFFLIRLPLMCLEHVSLQSGSIDIADRLFWSVADTWDTTAMRGTSSVVELVPELFYHTGIFKNRSRIRFGQQQSGHVVDNVMLPPWACGSPFVFTWLMRRALETPHASERISDWINLVYGPWRSGAEAVKRTNIFWHLCYPTEVLRSEEKERAISSALNIGVLPSRLFKDTHPKKSACCPRANITTHPSAVNIQSSSLGTTTRIHTFQDSIVFVDGQPIWETLDNSAIRAITDVDGVVYAGTSSGSVIAISLDVRPSRLPSIGVLSVMQSSHTTGRVLASVDGHSESITSLTAIPGWSALASIDESGLIRLWSLASLQALISEKFSALMGSNHISAHPQDGWLAVGNSNRVALISQDLQMVCSCECKPVRAIIAIPGASSNRPTILAYHDDFVLRFYQLFATGSVQLKCVHFIHFSLDQIVCFSDWQLVANGDSIQLTGVCANEQRTFILGFGEPEIREHWVDDTQSENCMRCSCTFTQFNRRHHCRRCGSLVCSDCSQNKIDLPYLGALKARVCNHCFVEEMTHRLCSV